MTRLRRVLAHLGPRERRGVALGLGVMLAAWLGLRGLPWALRAQAHARDRAYLAVTTLARA